MTDSLKATEEYSAAKATHPRVSLSDIEENIVNRWYVTLDDAVMVEDDMLRIVTLCVLRMRNGFIVLGKSAPASPENFDPEKGRLFAYEDAVRQVWPLMGYALKQRLFEENEVNQVDFDPDDKF